jgi:hypothetical protein
MKNRIGVSLWLMITGALISIGSQTVFKVCETKQMTMKCYWSARTEIVIGSFIFLAGILYIILTQWQAKLALSLMSLGAVVSAVIIPNLVIGVCANAMMHCRSIFLPAINLISILSMLVITGNLIYLRKLNKEKKPSQALPSLNPRMDELSI